MPQIIVAADRGAAFGEGTVTFRERVNVSDLESAHFAAQLLERLGWAVEDADVVERRQERRDSGRVVERRAEEPVATAELVTEEPEGVETRLEDSAAVHVPA